MLLIESPTICFKNNKNLRGHFLGVVSLKLEEVGRYKRWGRKRPPCQLCSNLNDKRSFKLKHFDEIYKIKSVMLTMKEPSAKRSCFGCPNWKHTYIPYGLNEWKVYVTY